MKFLKVIILLVLVNSIAWSQNYINLIDLSGYPQTSEQISELETKTNEIIQSLPQSVQDSFKVYDVGVYRLSNYMSIDLSVETFIDSVKNDIEIPYYIILGINNQGSLQYPKMIADIKLPNTEYFSCLSIAQLNSLTKELILEGNNALTIQKDFHSAKIRTLNYLKENLEKFETCCDPGLRTICSNCYSEKARRNSFLEGLFEPIKIDSTSISTGNRGSRFTYINDLTNGRNIYINGHSYDIVENLDNFFSSIENNALSIKITITDNYEFCGESTFNEIFESHVTSDDDINLHIHIDNQDNYLYIGDYSSIQLLIEDDTLPAVNPYRMFGANALTSKGSPPPSYPDVLTRFWNHQNYDWYKTEAQKFASNYSIPENNMYFYNYQVDPKDEFSVACFILIFHNNYGPTNNLPRIGPNKHRFIRNPFKQEIGLEWNNLWDSDGNPILTNEDLKDILPYAPIEWPKLTEDVLSQALTLGSHGIYKKIFLKKSKKVIAKKIAQNYKIYTFLTKADLQYFGQTIQKVKLRISQHKAKGKSIIENSDIILTEIPKLHPDSKVITDGIEELLIEYGKRNTGFTDQIHKISKKARPEYYEESITKAKNYLENCNTPGCKYVKERVLSIATELLN